jgi:predicted nucleic acid-binding protein
LNEIYVLDACALIALLSKEAGYEKVARIIEKTQNGEAKIIMHAINLLEVYYHLCKMYSEILALNFLDSIKNSPIQLNAGISDDIIISAGRQYKLSIADAIGIAEAAISNGSFVTADHHELDVIDNNENVHFTWIR